MFLTELNFLCHCSKDSFTCYKYMRPILNQPSTEGYTQLPKRVSLIC